MTASETLLPRLLAHPAVAEAPLMAQALHGLDLGRAALLDPSQPGDAAILASKGLRLKAPAPGSSGNLVVLADPDSLTCDVALDLKGLHGQASRDTVIILSAGANLAGDILLGRRGNLFVCGARATAHGLYLNFIQDDAAFLLQEDVRAEGFNAGLQGHGRSVCIGRRSILQGGIWMRTSDSHAIIDLDSRTVVNPPRNITVGDDVFIGRNALIYKGAAIGNGAAIAEDSLVSTALPPRCWAAGVPARIIGTDRDWRLPDQIPAAASAP